MKLRLTLLTALLITTALPAAALTAKPISFTAEVWADNWFSFYVNGKKVGEDSVPITVQKSFNSEVIKFTATYPLTFGFIAKDYVQSKSGLEYLNTPNQQIGDGGLIFQIRESSSNKLVAASDGSWKYMTANTAPTNPECEKSTQPDIDCKYLNFQVPSNWLSSTFNDLKWKSAVIYSANAVGPKEGYYNINWISSAKFIWGSDLKLDNVVYFRKKVLKPSSTTLSGNLSGNISGNFSMTFPNLNGDKLNMDNTCDGKAISPAISWSQIPEGTKSLALVMDTIPGPPRPGEASPPQHYYINISNILISKHGFNEGEISNYFPPCSQGPGLKNYRVFLYALPRELTAIESAAGAKVMESATKIAIATATKTLTYERKI